MAFKKLLRGSNADGLPVRLTNTEDNTVLVLAGKDRPQKGVGVKSKLRYDKTYYSGVDEATIHRMGQEQDPIRLQGRLFNTKDAQLAQINSLSEGGLSDLANPLVGGPRLKANYIQALFDQQAIVRLEWGENIDVRGVIAEIDLINYRHNVIGYEIVFDPMGPYQPDSRPVSKLFDQRAFGATLKSVRVVADQLLDAVYRTVMIGRRFTAEGSETADPGLIPDPLRQSQWYDEDRTRNLPSNIKPGSALEQNLSSVSSTASGGGSRVSSTASGGGSR